MACAFRPPHTFSSIWRDLRRGYFSDVWSQRKAIYGDIFGKYICKILGHDPYFVNEHDPNCDAVACKRCNKILDR